MPTPIPDPKSPASKPHGTTDDQIKEMENEGQAASSQATPEDAPSPRSEFDKTMSDQDIDTAGTDAEKP
ncbi:MAG: hypothetical protein WC815_17735 [Vicinamibacterales bacterium]|jgi:hypothetical protein